MILLAFVLLIVDLQVTNHGLPTVGGIATLILGTLMLFDATPLYLLASLTIFVVVAALTAVLFVVASREALAARVRPATTGMEGMAGEVGVVRAPVGADTTGWVFVHGELWRATTAVAPEDAYEQDRKQVIGIGRKIQVVDFRDGKVVVMPFEPATPDRLVREPG